MLVDQHRWARPFQRRVTGSQIRLAAATPAPPALVLCSVTPSCRLATPTSAARPPGPPNPNPNPPAARPPPPPPPRCPPPPPPPPPARPDTCQRLPAM